MPEESAENNPKTEAASEAKQEKGTKPNPFWPSRVIRSYVLGVVGVLCGGYGAALLNSHPKPLFTAWACIFVGLCFTAFGLRLWLINHRTKHPMHKSLPNLCCFGLILLGLIGCAFAILQENPQPVDIPRFKLSLGDIGADLDLPDSLMKFKNLSTKRRLAGIVLPVNSAADLPSLKWIVTNDSDVFSDSTEFVFGWHTGLAFDGPLPWVLSWRGDEDVTGMHWLKCKLDPIFPHNACVLPPLRLQDCAAISNNVAEICKIQIMPKDR